MHCLLETESHHAREEKKKSFKIQVVLRRTIFLLETKDTGLALFIPMRIPSNSVQGRQVEMFQVRVSLGTYVGRPAYAGMHLCGNIHGKKSQRSPKVGELASSFIDILQHLHFHEGLDILCISQNKHSRGLF